ncbi:MAG: cytochrome c-type biogenesis protein CcmH [Alphaproteobacteria bacterium]|nr:cytochrome c-type biogenesis protein CcmH [Alphaproteobacteria bacterium]
MRSLLIALLLFTAVPTLAVEPDEILADPALEARAREIGKELRCLVCQNQSIDDSDADLARDLRVLIRERLKAGDSDEAVMAFVVDRYGDYVLLKPPLKPATYPLWLGPLAIFGIALLVAFLYLHQRRRTALEPTPLSPDEERRIRELMDRHR